MKVTKWRGCTTHVLENGVRINTDKRGKMMHVGLDFGGRFQLTELGAEIAEKYIDAVSRASLRDTKDESWTTSPDAGSDLVHLDVAPELADGAVAFLLCLAGNERLTLDRFAGWSA